MLKRIKIRGKLLLLLATPLLAVLVFAATGILDRLDNRDFQDREARIADLADAGSDLQLAIQVSACAPSAPTPGSARISRPPRSRRGRRSTGGSPPPSRWRPDIRDPELIGQLDDLTSSCRPSTPAPTR